MSMELAIKTAVLGISAAIFSLIIKKHSPEIALLLTIAAAISISLAGLLSINAITSIWSGFIGSSGISMAVIMPVGKCVALGLITKLCSDLCRDAGSSSIASAVELTGCISALVVASPLISMLLEMLEGML